MDGASFSPCLIEDEKGDCHLDAPYYGLCPVTWLEQAGYRKKSGHSHSSTFSYDQPALTSYVVH